MFSAASVYYYILYKLEGSYTIFAPVFTPKRLTIINIITIIITMHQSV